MLLRVGIALLAIGAVAGIATAIFWDGPDRDRTIEYRITRPDNTAGEDGADLVVVRDDGDGRRGFFFPFFPLLVVGGVLVTVALITRGRGGWGGPRGRFDDWHREAHRSEPTSPTSSSG